MNRLAYVVLVGPPASGKGTQAALLCESLRLPHVASGDLLRENVRNATELGVRAKGYMDRGELVPDAVVIGMVMERLARPDCASGALLDGFPRTMAQAQALDESLAECDQRIGVVPYIVVPDEVLIERVSGRRLCRTCGTAYHLRFNPPQLPGRCDLDGGSLYQRDDDKPETMHTRLAVYREQTSPLIQYYAGRALLMQIDGNRTIAEVAADVRSVVVKRLKLTPANPPPP